MQPTMFLFLSDGRLFIRHATGEILQAEASARRHAASLMVVLEEIATVDPTRGLQLVPPAQSGSVALNQSGHAREWAAVRARVQMTRASSANATATRQLGRTSTP